MKHETYHRRPDPSMENETGERPVNWAEAGDVIECPRDPFEAARVLGEHLALYGDDR